MAERDGTTADLIVEGRVVDPEVAPLLRRLTPLGDDVAARRRAFDEVVRRLRLEPEDGTFVRQDLTVPGHADHSPVEVRIHRSNRRPVPSPAVLYIHGGGFTLGHLDVDDASCVGLCRELDCTVVSLNYRLAPENPFPAGLEDCYSVLLWLDAEAEHLGIDRRRLAVLGYSAGGGLAAALCLLAHDRGGPEIRFQALIYPELDDRFDNQSSSYDLDGLDVFSRAGKELSWACYLGDDAGPVSPYAAPARASDLRGLPPAYVVTAELDPLRDEGIDYAVRMLRNGVAVELHHVPGVPHGWDRVAREAAITERCHAELLAVLRAALRHPRG